MRFRKSKGNDFELDEAEDIIESVSITDCKVQTIYNFKFINSTFLLGDQVAFSFEQSNNDQPATTEIAGSIVLEFTT